MSDDSAYVNMDGADNIPGHRRGDSNNMDIVSKDYEEDQPKPKRKVLFLVPCVLVVVGVVVAIVLVSSSGSRSSDQDFCTECVNDADCNSCLGLPRDSNTPRASCQKAAETDSTGQCECMNDRGDGLGWFGGLGEGGCQNLNSLSQRAALFDLYDSLGGDTWVRSNGNDRITTFQPWYIEVEDDEGVGTGEMVQNNRQSYCAFEYVLCSPPNANGAPEISEFWGLTDDCFVGADVVLNPECDGIGLTGTIPDSIEDLTALRVLRMENPQDSNLGSNRISGTLPTGIVELVDLELFDVSRNLMTGNLPEEIGNLTKLTRFGISNNRINEPFLEPPKVSAGFTGSIPESIGQLVLLTTLDVSVNSFTGSIPSTIGNMTELQIVALERNQLTGSIPDTVRFLQNAQIFTVDQNSLDGALEFLEGGENGTLSCPVCEMRNLQVLQLGPVAGFGPGESRTNQISGSIPSKINQLADLATLALNNNRFTGCLPDTLADLNEPAGTRPDGLQTLALQNNNLGTGAGEICSLDVLGRMTELQQLSIRNNRFIGATLPPTFGDLENLDRLYVDHMGLVGEIPMEMEAVVRRTKQGEDCCIQFDRVPENPGPAGDCFTTQLLNFPAVQSNTCQIEQGSGEDRVDLDILDWSGQPYPNNDFVSPLPFFVCDTRKVKEENGVIVLTSDDDPDGTYLGCDGAGGMIDITNLDEYPFPNAADYAPLEDCDEPEGYESYYQVPDGENEALIPNIEKGRNKCKVDRTVLNWCINSDVTLPRSSPYSTSDSTQGGFIGGQNACRNFN